VIAEAELQAARGYAAEARELPDDEARAMLVEAARLLHSVVRNANRVLDSLPPQRVLEAVCEPASPPAQGSPQSRPRRGSDPVFTLMRLGKEAASLLKRVLAKTNPGVGKVIKAA
jgi:hypothetical protein